MEFTIEDDIPIPDGTRSDSNITAAIRSLKPGQSVFIPGKKAVEMSGFVTNAGMRGKLTMRTTQDGVRVWHKHE